MPQTEKPSPRTGAPPADDLPPVVPRRKRPLLLALAVALFATWLAFLIYMAVQG